MRDIREIHGGVWSRGLFTPLTKLDITLEVKLGKLATAIGVPTIRSLGYSSKTAFIEEKTAWLLKPT